MLPSRSNLPLWSLSIALLCTLPFAQACSTGSSGTGYAVGNNNFVSDIAFGSIDGVASDGATTNDGATANDGGADAGPVD